MTAKIKPVESLQIPDLERTPVWQFARAGETFVFPVKKLPVKNLTGKLIATQVRLANGNRVWALIGNVDLNNPRVTNQFLTLSILHETEWFTLARYHDCDYIEHGPDSMALFLGLPIDEIFPISYDISKCADGDSEALCGAITREPREKLSRSEIIAMALRR